MPSPSYRFETRADDGRVEVRDAAGATAFTFQGFASIAGVVAALVGAIVVTAGAAATVFLVSNGAILRAGAAGAITIAFAAAIGALTPRHRAALHDASAAVLKVRQTAVFTSSTWAVADPEGNEIAILRRPLRSRLGRERWSVERDGRIIAEALEDSRWRFLGRSILGAFTRRWRANLRITTGGIECAALRRRGPRGCEIEITNRALDPRIPLALGVVIFGGER